MRHRPHRGKSEIARWTGSLTTAEPLLSQPLSAGGACGPLQVILTEGDRSVLRYAPDEIVPVPSPTVATEPPLPKKWPATTSSSATASILSNTATPPGTEIYLGERPSSATQATAAAILHSVAGT